MSLVGRIAIVTGASQGIGARVAQHLASEGARVVLVARSRANLESVAKSIGSSRSALAVPTDVLDLSAVERAFDEAQAFADGAPVDLLVNNAGGPVAMNRFEDSTDDEALQTIALNLTAKMRVTRVFARRFKRLAAPDAMASIVNVSSIAAHRAWPMLAAYSAAKAGVRATTKALAQEWAAAPRAIRVNDIEAGWIKNGTSVDAFLSTPAKLAVAVAAVPLGALGDVDDVASAVAFLSDNERAKYVTGAALAVDGGLGQAVAEDWARLRAQLHVSSKK